jgi:putative hydrolase of the HAD superfamily
MSRRAILWDFDGTLVERPGLWRRCLFDVLDEHEPGHGIDADALAPYLKSGFPWHSPEVEHAELNDPDNWWETVGKLFARGYQAVGIADDRATVLAAKVRAHYCDPRHWNVFPDVVPVLTRLREAGWRHAILSNHVPELRQLVASLGLADLFDDIVNSAETGFEKPHPRAFALAQERLKDPDEVWMVGDNPVADVAGAEACGIPAVLVRRQGDPTTVTRYADDLWAVEAAIARG